MKDYTRKYYNALKKIIFDTLGGEMSISVSETSFGVSMYVSDENYKLRFSDHGISNFNRMSSEECYDIKDIIDNPQLVKSAIRTFFSGEMTKLILSTDTRRYDLGMVYKSDLGDWEKCIVVSATETEKVIHKTNFKSSNIRYDNNLMIVNVRMRDGSSKEMTILRIKGETKKKVMYVCDILKNTYNWGVYNKKTGELRDVHEKVYSDQNDGTYKIHRKDRKDYTGYETEILFDEFIINENLILRFDDFMKLCSK